MKYFGWVLLLELVCIASPLRAEPQAPCLAYYLLKTTNILFLSSEYGQKRMWQVLSTSVQQKVTGSSRHREQHHRQGQQHEGHGENTRVPVGASESTAEQMWQSTVKVEPGKTEQELLFSSSYSHSLRIQNLHWTCFPYMKFCHFLSKGGGVISCSSTEQYSSFQTNNYNI